ncbi:MAG: hypothetical protein F4Y47_04270 [Acidobacteriia bacterium]|nr:hypothetical protein [Terriglobia bacterium]MYG04665.1 hypothetical protein [Terriglobia bacterium]MYK09714.1 hypothetical protein [Terriglobia bacterium]
MISGVPYTATVLSTVGLTLDIIGVVMLFRCGLPANVSRKGDSHVLLEATDQREVGKARKHDRLARVGLALIVIGFTIRILGNWI